ncbi:hypothetical protein [Thioclava sp. JM3]|nr:hypothetical protein [Thioclava sp. JM3]
MSRLIALFSFFKRREDRIEVRMKALGAMPAPRHSRVSPFAEMPKPQ